MTESRSRFLRRVRARMRLAWLSATAQAYAPYVAAAIVVTLAIDWLTLFDQGLAVSAGFAGLFALLLLARAATMRITSWDAARAAEMGLNARDAFTTALEFTDDADGVHRMIQRQADRLAGEATATEAIAIRPDGSRLRQLGVAGALALLIGLLPPLGSTPAMSSDVATALDEEAARIERMAEAVEEAEVDSAEDIAAELEALAQELRQAQTLEEALGSLEDADARLGEQLDPDFLSQKAAVQGLARDLALRPLTEDAPLDAASQFQQLSDSLDSLSDPERAALADRLSDLAESQASGNPELSSQLAEASRALDDGDLSEAARALEQASAEHQSGLDGARDQQALSETRRALEGARARLSGSGIGQEGASQEGDGRDGRGEGQGQREDQGQGQSGQGGDDGESGAGQGAGQGGDPAGGGGEITGVAPGDGNASGQGQQGSVGAGDGQDHGTDVETANVFTPLDEGALSDLIQVDIEGGSGEGDVVGQAEAPTVRGQSVVPYARVLPEYLNQAADALGELQLPPSMRAIVQSYFDLLADEAR